MGNRSVGSNRQMGHGKPGKEGRQGGVSEVDDKCMRSPGSEFLFLKPVIDL